MECNDGLRKFTETSLTLKITVKIYLNYEISRTKIWNMSPEIFQKVEIWALIFLSMKFCRRFSIITYPSIANDDEIDGLASCFQPCYSFQEVLIATSFILFWNSCAFSKSVFSISVMCRINNIWNI